MKAVLENLEIRPNVVLKKGQKVWIVLGDSVSNIISREIVNITLDNDLVKHTGDLSDLVVEQSPISIEVVSSYGTFSTYSDVTLKNIIFLSQEDAEKFALSYYD